jgi:hypothetical protein
VIPGKFPILTEFALVLFAKLLCCTQGIFPLLLIDKLLDTSTGRQIPLFSVVSAELVFCQPTYDLLPTVRQRLLFGEPTWPIKNQFELANLTKSR